MREFAIHSTHGRIVAKESQGDGLPVVLLHGNSASQDVFVGQTKGPLARDYRIITLDLPGHGKSQDAIDPQRTYTLPGYADAVIDVLRDLGISRAVFVGWSLGGHVALELMSRWDGAVAVAITGAPPARSGIEGLMEAFQPHPAFGLLSQPHLNDEQITLVADAMVGELHIPMLKQAIRRTDGRARQILFSSLAEGQAADERKLVETSHVPVAIIDGEHEPFASAAFLASVKFQALWRGAPVQIPQAGHAPFLDNPRSYNAQLGSFLREVDVQPAKRMAA
jgi:pimeloyl-ACP methyl ester carboxylesterase